MKWNKTYSIGILLLVSLSCKNELGVKPPWSKNYVRKAINSWELENSIKVDYDMEKLIERECSGWDKSVFTGEDVALGTELYLYEIRDRKSELPMIGNMSNITIEDSQLYYPMGNFDFLILQKPKGYLKVTSKPVGANIMIDGVSKGKTNRKYVLSSGKHTISVKSSFLDCHDEITITEGETETYHCP